MIKYKVIVTSLATDDINGINDYITEELKEEEKTKGLISSFKEAMISLDQLPTRHNLVSDEQLSYLGIRKLLVENYIVFYVVSEKNKTVTVVRVLHNRRDWNNLI